MHDDKQEMKALLSRMDIPEPASNLESRIIAAAKPRVQQAKGSGWFASLFPQHTAKYALVAAALMVAVMVMPADEQGSQVTPQSSEAKTAALSAEEREAAEALLAELELVEDPFEEVDYASIF